MHAVCPYIEWVLVMNNLHIQKFKEIVIIKEINFVFGKSIYIYIYIDFIGFLH